MAMVDVDGSCHLSADSAQVSWLGLRVGGHPALSLHSSNERVNSRSDHGHEDSIINIVVELLLLLLLLQGLCPWISVRDFHPQTP